MTLKPNRYESISIDRLGRYISDPVLGRSDDGDIRIDIDGQDESIYRNPGHGPEQWGGLGGWESCSADEIAAVLGTILDEGLIMEMRVDNQYGDSTIMIDSPDGLDPYIEVMPYGSRQIEFRRIDRTGRMFLALFLNTMSNRFLGSIEMLKPPLSGWLWGGDPGPISAGDLFLTPPQTLPLDVKYRMIDGSKALIHGAEPGIHLFSWLLDRSMERTSVRHLGRRIGPESVIISASRGIDLFDIHWRSVFDGPGSDIDIYPNGYALDEWYPGVFMGTYPSACDRDILVSGRTVEQALSYLVYEGGGRYPVINTLSDIGRDMHTSDTLFDQINRGTVDPFYIQKIFKLPKIETRIESIKIKSDFPDSAAIHLIKTALRRGLDQDRIASGLGVSPDLLAGYIDTFDIKPRLKFRGDVSYQKHVPLIISWPEVGVEGEWMPDLPSGESDPAVGDLVFEAEGNGKSRIILTSDPAFLLGSNFTGSVVLGPETENLAGAVLSSGKNVGRVQIYTQAKID